MTPEELKQELKIFNDRLGQLENQVQTIASHVLALLDEAEKS